MVEEGFRNSRQRRANHNLDGYNLLSRIAETPIKQRLRSSQLKTAPRSCSAMKFPFLFYYFIKHFLRHYVVCRRKRHKTIALFSAKEGFSTNHKV